MAKCPVGVLVMGRSGDAICVGSVAVSLAVLISLPPEAVTELVTVAVVAVGGTVTVKVMAGKLDAAFRTSERVQVSVPRLQIHPVPLMAVATSGLGRVSTTVIVPFEFPPPILLTVMVY